MPLAIDGSTPAGHTATTQANTCAAFVPPESPLLIALWAGNTGGSDVSAPSVASTPSQTWATDAWDHAGSGSPFELGQAAFFHAVVAGSPGSTTVTVTNGQTVNQWSSILKVLVMTGADPGTPVGAAKGGRQESGSSFSDSYTASITGGQGFMVVCDWNAGATSGWTAATGCTVIDKGTLTGEISYATLQRTTADGVVGVSTTMGLSGLPTGGNYHWCMAEVISIEAAEAVSQLIRSPRPSEAAMSPPEPSQLL